MHYGKDINEGKKNIRKKEMDLVIHYLTKNQNIQILLVHDIIRMEAKF